MEPIGSVEPPVDLAGETSSLRQGIERPVNSGRSAIYRREQAMPMTQDHRTYGQLEIEASTGSQLRVEGDGGPRFLRVGQQAFERGGQARCARLPTDLVLDPMTEGVDIVGDLIIAETRGGDALAHVVHEVGGPVVDRWGRLSLGTARDAGHGHGPQPQGRHALPHRHRLVVVAGEPLRGGHEQPLLAGGAQPGVHLIERGTGGPTAESRHQANADVRGDGADLHARTGAPRDVEWSVDEHEVEVGAVVEIRHAVFAEREDAEIERMRADGAPRTRDLVVEQMTEHLVGHGGQSIADGAGIRLLGEVVEGDARQTAVMRQP